MLTKSKIAIVLSKLKVFDNPKLMSEQYPTDSEIASNILYEAACAQLIQDQVIADFGAGTGILGICCLLMGAKKVYFIERDVEAFKTLKENIVTILKDHKIDESQIELINDNIENFNQSVDLIIQNPPFGTKIKHADRVFLEKAYLHTNYIITLNKSTSTKFIESISKDNDFTLQEEIKYDLPLKAVHSFHKRKIQRIEVSAYFICKNK